MLNVAVPPESAVVPRFVAPSKKVTVPVGVIDVAETDAVNITFCPGKDGFTDDAREMAAPVDVTD